MHSSNPFHPQPRAFISYARSDGEEIALNLRARLSKEHPEIGLWIDRSAMVGGLGWWKQITEALERVEIMIMVLTPDAMRSDVAAKEWRFARQQGVRICPVTRNASILNSNALPGWIRRTHCYDLDREWTTFIGFLLSAGAPTRVPFMAPDHKEALVPRIRETQVVHEYLLNGSGLPHSAPVAALYGAGGFGKTTLATMLCHDDDIITAFDDGILWATLGPTPNLQGELTKLYAALTGERPPFVDVEDASIQLAHRLDQRRCLLVIDDVWQSAHARPFMRGGDECARLLTTRHFSVASEFATARTVVRKMDSAESVQLLANKTSTASPDIAELRRLAERLGHYPLLLRLAASQLRDRIQRGDTMPKALDYMSRALDKRGVIAFDRADPKTRDEAVRSTIDASLAAFSVEDQRQCAALAIFPAQIEFPLAAVSVLWELDETDTEALLLQLDDAGLLDFDIKTASVRIHEVLRAYFTGKLGSSIPFHGRLADCWLACRYHLPDTYAWTWIGWHLAKGGRLEELKQLLFDCKWLECRLRATSVQILLQDYEHLELSSDVKSIRDAIRLSAAALSFDSAQLRTQFLGRIERGTTEALDSLLNYAEAADGAPRLRLMGPSLTHPGGALTGILRSHTGSVEALAVAPDGRHVVSAAADATLRLWDLQTSTVVRVMEGHLGTVRAVAFAPDGASIVSGSADRTIRQWDSETGKLRRVLSGHTLSVRGVVFSPCGRLLYSASEDGSVREWNLSAGVSEVLFQGAFHNLGPLVITADSRWLIFGAGDWTIQIYDLLQRSLAQQLDRHAGVVRCLALAPDGETLVSGGEDELICVWDLKTCCVEHELRGHDASVETVAIAALGNLLVSGSCDRTLRVWNWKTGRELQTFSGHSDIVKAAVVVADSGRMLSGSADQSIREWNLQFQSMETGTREQSRAIAELGLSFDGLRAVSIAEGREFSVWTALPGASAREAIGGRPSTLVLETIAGHSDAIRSIDLTTDGAVAVTGSRDRTIKAWDLRRQRAVYVLRGHNREIIDVRISSDHRRVVSVSRDRSIRVWDLRSGIATRVLVADDDTRIRLAAATNSAMLADINQGFGVDRFPGPMPAASVIALSAQADRIVFGWSGGVCLWTVSDGTVEPHSVGDLDVSAIEFGPDETFVVIGSKSGPIAYWRFGDAPVVWSGHSDEVCDIAITDDGSRAVSAGLDDSFCVWHLGGGKVERRWAAGIGRPDAVAVARTGEVGFGVYGHALVAFDLKAWSRLSSLSFDHPITAMAANASGTQLAVGDFAGRVHFVSLSS